jgi:hypothetical protein
VSQNSFKEKLWKYLNILIIKEVVMAFQFISPEIDPYIGVAIFIAAIGFIIYLATQIKGEGGGIVGPRGPRGPAGPPGPSPLVEPRIPERVASDEKIEIEEEDIKRLEQLEQAEIKDVDKIITALRVIIELIDKYKEQPNALLLIKQKLVQLKPLVRNVEVLHNELKKILEQLVEFEKKEVKQMIYKLGQVKLDLYREKKVFWKKKLNKKQQKVRELIEAYVERIKNEALSEFKITVKQLKSGVTYLNKFDKKFMRDFYDGVLALDAGDIKTAKDHFYECIGYMNCVKGVLRHMEKVERVKEKITHHELKDFRRENDAKRLLRKILRKR